MQFNTVFNSNNKLLDLILCNKFRILDISHCSNPFVPEDVHHPCIEFIVDIGQQKPLQFNCSKYFNFKKANYEIINQKIMETDWSSVCRNKSLKSCLGIFYNIIENIVKQNVPTYSKNKYFSTFYSHSTIRAVKEKNKFHKRWRKF